MVDVKELQKALKQFPRPPYSIEHDSEKWNAWTEDVINWFDELKRLFSAFQELSLKERSLRKQLQEITADLKEFNQCHEYLMIETLICKLEKLLEGQK